MRVFTKILGIVLWSAVHSVYSSSGIALVSTNCTHGQRYSSGKWIHMSDKSMSKHTELLCASALKWIMTLNVCFCVCSSCMFTLIFHSVQACWHHCKHYWIHAWEIALLAMLHACCASIVFIVVGAHTCGLAISNARSTCCLWTTACALILSTPVHILIWWCR